MSEVPVRGIVVAHSDLARALIDAVQRIAGPDEGALVPLSNEGLGPDAMREELDALAADDPVIVFADLREGSCGMAGRKACMAYGGNRALVTGVNLPILLDFVLNRQRPLEELVPRLVDRGRAAITDGLESRK